MNLDETRNGILKCLENKGNTAPMKVLHGYSKLIYQVAHREFSEVMEGLVIDKLVIFNDDTFILTEEGSDLVKSL
jgi:predicted transcriptional regulator